jgi:hypothetical protein
LEYPIAAPKRVVALNATQATREINVDADRSPLEINFFGDKILG